MEENRRKRIPRLQREQNPRRTASTERSQQYEQRDATAIAICAHATQQVLEPRQGASHQSNRVSDVNRIAKQQIERHGRKQDPRTRMENAQRHFSDQPMAIAETIPPDGFSGSQLASR